MFIILYSYILQIRKENTYFLLAFNQLVFSLLLKLFSSHHFSVAPFLVESPPRSLSPHDTAPHTCLSRMLIHLTPFPPGHCFSMDHFFSEDRFSSRLSSCYSSVCIWHVACPATLSTRVAAATQPYAAWFVLIRHVMPEEKYGRGGSLWMSLKRTMKFLAL
jgi:hypothetical protein